MSLSDSYIWGQFYWLLTNNVFCSLSLLCLLIFAWNAEHYFIIEETWYDMHTGKWESCFLFQLFIVGNWVCFASWAGFGFCCCCCYIQSPQVQIPAVVGKCCLVLAVELGCWRVFLCLNSTVSSLHTFPSPPEVDYAWGGARRALCSPAPASV